MFELFLKELKFVFNEKYQFPKSQKKTHGFIENYFYDVEHGFFHSFCCCYISYIINDKIDEKIVLSLFLHDFLKCNGYKQELHDKELVNYYPNLLPETYIHSNPPKHYEDKLVIFCDRIELRRYPDYKDWVDERYYKMYDRFDSNKKKHVDFFYNNTRILLENAYNEFIILLKNKTNTKENIDKIIVVNKNIESTLLFDFFSFITTFKISISRS